MLTFQINPFENQSTYDFDDYKSQPFIVDNGFQTPKILKNKLIFNATAIGSSRVLIKIISSKGAGKSTLSFYLQDNLEQLDNPNILVFYTNKIGMNYYEFIEELMYEFDINKYKYKARNNEAIIKKFLEDKKLYLFIDFQDIMTSSSFKILANTLENVGPLSKNISIILTLNKSHAVKMENYSLVLGKYTQFELSCFSLENTKNLIIERLKLSRDKNYLGDGLSPFENVVNLIYNHSGGIPRNIISACDLLFTNFKGETIDLQEASILLKGEFAKKVIQDMTDEGFERDYLVQLYDIVKDNFNGEILKEKDLHDFLEKNYRWSNRTCRKRIRKLSSYGLINITKGEDLWSNTIRII